MLPDWVESKREDAKSRYLASETPLLKYGLTIRLNTKDLKLEGREDHNSEQVITIEHENCEVLNLFDNFELVKDYLFSTSPNERTRFDDFNESFFDIGLLIIVPENSKAKVDLSRTIASETFKERILVICKKNSELELVDKYNSNNCELKSGTVEVITEDNAKVRYAEIQYLGEDCFDLTSHQSITGKDSSVDWFIASLGSKLSRATVDNVLGEGSESRSYGVYHGNNNQQFDLSASSVHLGSHSKSDMYTRGVLDDKAKAVYRGLINIDENAFGCDGYQQEETILVSDDAVADAIPNLEIKNNDVKCSHGASIGRIDEEQLFYLLSRGVSKPEAIRMVVEGFFEPVTHKLGWPELFEIIQPMVQEKML